MVGDIETLREIQPLLSQSQKDSTAFVSTLIYAYCANGYGDPLIAELLEQLEAAKRENRIAQLQKTFPLRRVFTFLKSNPQFLPQCK